MSLENNQSVLKVNWTTIELNQVNWGALNKQCISLQESNINMAITGVHTAQRNWTYIGQQTVHINNKVQSFTKY